MELKNKRKELTPKEKHIINLISQGYNDTEIAEMEKLSYNRIRGIRTTILMKMDAINSCNMIFKAVKKGII